MVRRFALESVPGCLRLRAACAMVLIALAPSVAPAGDAPAGGVARAGWSFDRSVMDWYTWAKPKELKASGSLRDFNGWLEYDFAVPEGGWHELVCRGGVAGWNHDIWLDGENLLPLTVAEPEDAMLPGRSVDECWKEANLYLRKGSHSLRFARWGWPGAFPSSWELRPSGDAPAGCVRARLPRGEVTRLGDGLAVIVEGGTGVPTSYEIVAKNEATGEFARVGSVEFPASPRPVRRHLRLRFPAEGVYMLLARTGGKLLRPSDLKAGRAFVVDVNPASPAAAKLERTLIVEIDCAEERRTGFWERDGATRVVETPFGRYRESSGAGTVERWGMDGFSYAFDLPDKDHTYMLEVDYPDDKRRTMGFWINDGTEIGNRDVGTVMTGGVETGDHYPLSRSMLTHTSLLWPRGEKGLLFAAISLNPGMRAAASRVRVYRIDSRLTAGARRSRGGRRLGYYFEEPGRWIRQFGGDGGRPLDHLVALDRWGQLCRYMGADLMYPTVNVYQTVLYPSEVLATGWFCSTYDLCRLNALVAEKYGCAYVPELAMTGQWRWDKHVMGVWFDEDAKKLHFATPDAEELVHRRRDGATEYPWKGFVFNALHPKVQAKYIEILGELADRLAGYESFEGISSRLMLQWQWCGWNALPGLNWGYDDWTVAAFEKETGVHVPVAPDDPDRFGKRFDFITGKAREKWLDWRSAKMLDYHRRMRDRIRRAKPDAKLFLWVFNTDEWHGGYGITHARRPAEQLREVGIDIRLYADEPGIVIMPCSGFGRRYSTPAKDASVWKVLYDEDLASVGRTGERGFLFYGEYFEPCGNFDWTPLGGRVPVYGAFDSCMPGGPNEREMHALALANCDSSIMLHGGNGWFFGTQAVLTPFMQEYKALPAEHFSPLDGADDPVAVWQCRRKDGLYFYAVNRMPYGVRFSVRVRSGGRVERLSATPADVKILRDGTVSLALEPFMVRSFKARRPGARLVDPKTLVPDAERERLAKKMELARSLRADVAARPEFAREVELLDEALRAFDEGRYWRAGVNLERVETMRLLERLGRSAAPIFE